MHLFKCSSILGTLTALGRIFYSSIYVSFGVAECDALFFSHQVTIRIICSCEGSAIGSLSMKLSHQLLHPLGSLNQHIRIASFGGPWRGKFSRNGDSSFMEMMGMSIGKSKLYRSPSARVLHTLIQAILTGEIMSKAETAL